MTKEDVRILTSVEMGMKNHEFVPEQLIESIAHLRRCGVFGRIQVLMKHGLLCHEGGHGDGYKLTYNGYDCLSLRALTNRGLLSSIGTRIGVGKESDIHMCTDEHETPLVVKFHRLGRISFRAVKSKRDYLQGRSHASWQYLARLAARKEYEYMKVLYDAGFPVPKPIDNNRHAVLMEYMQESVPMYQLPSDLPADQIEKLLDVVFKLLMRFAACGLIHGDFNEFNLLVNLKEIKKITVIDFPQIISVEHPEAKHQFERDVRCIERFFGKRFRIEVTGPTFEEAFQIYLGNKDGALNLKVQSGEDDDLLLRLDEDEEDGEEVDDEGNEDEDDWEVVDKEEIEEEEEVEVEADQVEVELEHVEVAELESEFDESESDSGDSEESDGDAIETPRRKRKDDIIQDPRHVLKAKKRLEMRNAPKISIIPQTNAGKSNAKPNKQKRGQHSVAAREVRAWKSEGGW